MDCVGSGLRKPMALFPKWPCERASPKSEPNTRLHRFALLASFPHHRAHPRHFLKNTLLWFRSAFCIALMAASVEAAWRPIGNMTASPPQGNQIIFHNAHATVSITVLAPGMVRVRMAARTHFGPGYSWADSLDQDARSWNRANGSRGALTAVADNSEEQLSFGSAMLKLQLGSDSEGLRGNLPLSDPSTGAGRCARAGRGLA